MLPEYGSLSGKASPGGVGVNAVDGRRDASEEITAGGQTGQASLR
jgi:hypothetical protein